MAGDGHCFKHCWTCNTLLHTPLLSLLCGRTDGPTSLRSSADLQTGTAASGAFCSTITNNFPRRHPQEEMNGPSGSAAWPTCCIPPIRLWRRKRSFLILSPPPDPEMTGVLLDATRFAEQQKYMENKKTFCGQPPAAPWQGNRSALIRLLRGT